MNTQNSILLIDPAFVPSSAENCSLLVRVGIDSFSYAILDKEKNTVCAVFDEQECDDVLNKLSDRLKNDTYLALPFKDVKLAIHTENNISLPNLLQEHDAINLNTIFFNRTLSGDIYTANQANFGFTSVFSFLKLTDEIINEHLTNSKKFPLNTALLKLAENIADSALMLDFTAGSIQVLYLKQNQVIFQQGYEIDNVEEFNYYLLLIMNQLAINSNATTVYLTGIIHENDDKYSCIASYFNTINFLNFVDSNLDQSILEDMPSHYYTTLLTLDQCV